MPSTPLRGPAGPHWRGRSCVAIRPIARLMIACRRSRPLALPPIPRSSRTGGCTFPEDPRHSCAAVRPIWSAIADPRVIAVRAGAVATTGARVFDASDPTVRVLRSYVDEHLLVDRGDLPIRLDIIDGTVLAGPASLRFDLPDDHHLEARLAVIRAFTSAVPPGRSYLQLAKRLHALHAIDARDAGASLREIADVVLGPGDWPGDGEHRKSMVRRMLASGDQMRRDGPRAILSGRLSPPDRSTQSRQKNRGDAC